jgi:STE24 endopeptidase
VSRLLLLLVMVIWLGADAAPPRAVPLPPTFRLFLFFGGYALIVLIPALWSRVLARYVAIMNLHRSLSRFSWGTMIARGLIAAWFAVGVFALGWCDFVYAALGPIARWPLDLPAAAVGTAPAMLAWMAMWWAAFPADRALREQSLLLQLQDDLPLHAPPGFWSYFGANLRMQVLFTIIPIALILLIRDIASAGLYWGFGINLYAAKINAPSATDAAKTIEWTLVPISAALVFILAPEILRRVLQTQPLPDSPLRRRLEDMCRRAGLRYRDILLWRTGNNMGNAAVMGVLPQVRYILLSDLLLESMTDQQIEAVFAHEAGHVVHRHIAWYGVFVVIVIASQLLCAKLADVFDVRLLFLPVWLRDPIILALAVALFFLLFGILSRWFERQADVYAARTMELELQPAAAEMKSADSTVGLHGANIFASALHRVAVVNNISVSARNFSHGSIRDRINYLRGLSVKPSQTLAFDRFMRTLYLILGGALVASIAWVAVLIWHG